MTGRQEGVEEVKVVERNIPELKGRKCDGWSGPQPTCSRQFWAYSEWRLPTCGDFVPSVSQEMWHTRKKMAKMESANSFQNVCIFSLLFSQPPEIH